MLIQEKLSQFEIFTDVEKEVVLYFIKHREKIKNMTVRDIASVSFTSASTVIRVCKKLGFDGYNEFKEKFLEEMKYLYRNFKDIDANKPFEKNEKTANIPHIISSLYRETINDTLSLFNEEKFIEIIDILYDAKVIYVVSNGDSLDIAMTFKSKMSKIGKKVVINRRDDELFYEINSNKDKVAYIIISYSGETPSVIKLANAIRSNNKTLIAITSIGGNTLSSFTPYIINISSHERLRNNTGSFASSLSVLFILDSIYASIFNLDYDSNYEFKTKVSKSFEINRKSDNPIIE